MTPQDAIAAALNQSEFVWKPYLLGMPGPDGQRQGGLNDADLLVRPCAGANHIAWQLGHLISSENGMISEVCPGTMPELPAGFAEQYTRETAGIDDPAAFLTIAEYVALADEQRAGTLAALSAADLQAESPEKFRMMSPHVAGIFLLAGSHWLMHAGQWAIVRRQLGHPALF